jgi:hypothetical protein
MRRHRLEGGAPGVALAAGDAIPFISSEADSLLAACHALVLVRVPTGNDAMHRTASNRRVRELES